MMSFIRIKQRTDEQIARKSRATLQHRTAMDDNDVSSFFLKRERQAEIFEM
jgi:hypothetical protein